MKYRPRIMDSRSATPQPRGVSRGSIATLALCVTFSAGMIGLAFSAVKDTGRYASAAQATLHQAGSCAATGSAATVAPPAAQRPRRPSEAPTQQFQPGLAMPLRASVTNARLSGAQEYVELADALPAGRVTLVNLWAPWCKPCLEEMPLLKTVFESLPDKVTFVPILIGTEGATVKQFAATFPPFDAFLSDFSGAVADGLSKAGLYESVPVTMLLGCRRTVRWIHFGVLREVDVVDLKSTAEALVAEIGTGACGPVGGGGGSGGAAATADGACGNGRCDMNEGEDNCCHDCCLPANGYCDEGENPNSQDCRREAAKAKKMESAAPNASQKHPAQLPVNKYDKL